MISCGCSQFKSHLFNKVITWADGSTEHVQIASDGFFYLNGEKRRLIGMVLGLQYLPAGEYGQFYLPRNMAMYEKELAYLQSVGIRLIHFEMGYVYNYLGSFAGEQKAYKDLMDLAYKHKMLVIPEICGLNHPAFGSLQVNDFLIPVDLPDGSTDSMGKWAARWINTVSAYANVVGVVADNELDINQDSHGYTATAVASYMSFLTGILRTKYDGPILAKLAGTNNQKDLIEPEIKKACIDTTDMVGFDCYADSKTAMENQMNILQTWLGNSGYPTTGWWCLELNHGTGTQDFDVGYMETILNHGAAQVCLFPSNWKGEPGISFFDNMGNPMPKLVEISKEISRLQAPEPENN